MSDHIPDVTKMISDTPRMHAALMDAPDAGFAKIWQVGCEIERELHAANAEIERLTNKVAQLYRGAEEQNQRIKRLEEAGDVLCAAAAFMGWHMEIEKWNKAKEAQP